MNILLTGGSGSFGQAAVKYLLRSNDYNKICIYSRGEHRQEQMKEKFDDSRLRFWIGDIRDKDRLQFAMDQVDHVVHAAALKVVPSGEYQPFEFVKTNILGSQNVIDCAMMSPYTKKVMALSTDKAVFPINLYGSTKLCMEKMFFASNNVRGESGPRFSITRYGNCAGSNGSLLPVFAGLMAGHEELPITHRGMTRFWLRLEEAVEFTFNSLKKMQGGELFIPDMPSFKVSNVAHAFGRETKPIGIRPGEKIHENLFTPDECEKYNLHNLPKDSGSNNTWLSVEDIRKELKEMGYL